MPDFDADLKDLGRLQKDLQIFSKKSIPFATRNALNETAILGRKLWKGEMGRRFILRNKFVVGSLRVVKVSRGQNVAQMFSMIGSISPFMGLQESGGTKSGKTGAVPIPNTPALAGFVLGAQSGLTNTAVPPLGVELTNGLALTLGK